MPESFLSIAGVRSIRLEDIFSKRPVRTKIMAMSTNQSYIRINRRTFFHYKKFNLYERVVYLNGQQVVGIPISTTTNERVYFKMHQFFFIFLIKTCHGFPLAEYPNHFVLSFVHASTEEAKFSLILK